MVGFTANMLFKKSAFLFRSSSTILFTTNHLCIFLASKAVAPLMASPLPAGDHVLVLCHNPGHHPVLQLLPAEFLDAFHPGHCNRGRPPAVTVQPFAQVQVSASSLAVGQVSHDQYVTLGCTVGRAR